MGVVLSSFLIAAVVTAVALILGAILGTILILHRRRHPQDQWRQGLSIDLSSPS